MSANPSSGGRTSITVLLLGDEGVGKSSLISTFVSRHFSERVPGIMTRVRLPPDPAVLGYSPSTSSRGTPCLTTIMDSQGADSALLAAVAARAATAGDRGSLTSISSLEGFSNTNPLPGFSSEIKARMAAPSVHFGGAIDHVDSIILVYDLDKVETFYRLENYWLPLIEKCYRGELPVIIAGNKLDLFRHSNFITPTSATRASNNQESSSTDPATFPAGSGSTSSTSPVAPANTPATANDEQSHIARSHRQLVAVLQRFKFVRQCIKCSAKNLLNVDEVFLKAQQAVLYPIIPLYDLSKGCIATDCKRAFTRIFRMYDVDNDGLLSNAELGLFQSHVFNAPLAERNFAGWKKVVSRSSGSVTTNEETESVVRDGKFTVAGFMAIFDIFISQNRLDVPWKILRSFGYDDGLNLDIPETVLSTSTFRGHQATVVHQQHHRVVGRDDWSLTLSARHFLTAIFHQFNSDEDGVLSIDDLLNVFAVIPEPSYPPWHPFRATHLFAECISLPRFETRNRSSSSTIESCSSSPNSQTASPLSVSASGITICSAESLPSVNPVENVSIASANDDYLCPLSFLDWMGYWHMMSAISPSVSRAELYRLGHVEDSLRGVITGVVFNKGRGRSSWSSKHKSPTMPAVDYLSVLLPSKETRIFVLGRKGCGKTAFIESLRSNRSICVGPRDTPEDIFLLENGSILGAETSFTWIHVQTKEMLAGEINNDNGNSGDVTGSGSEFVSYLLLTEIPEISGNALTELDSRITELSGMICGRTFGGRETRLCDLVVLLFDPADPDSFSYVKDMESMLPTDDMPRVFVGMKRSNENDPLSDKRSSIGASSGSQLDRIEATTMGLANQHCVELDLEPPLWTSYLCKNDGENGRIQLLMYLTRCMIDRRLRTTPHGERKRREAVKRKKNMWIVGVFGLIVFSVIGVFLFPPGSARGKKERPKERFASWYRYFFSSSLTKTTTVS